MQLHRIQAATLAALLVGVTALAACGSDDTSSSTSGNNGGNSGNSGNGGNNGGNTPAAIVAGTKSTLALLETTDLHTNVLSYDYFKLAEDKSLGFERVSTLIKSARQEFPNSLLLDNGDTIQGTALSDYQALVKPVSCTETLAMYKVMNAAGFDGGGIGNHEFNYGLQYLSQVTGSKFNVDGLPDPTAQTTCAGPKFPQVLANVYSVKTRAPLFQPYAILSKTLTATGPDGKTVTAPIKVGIIGFAPPAILSWDKRWLDGKVYTEGLVETAQKYIPEMRAKGADLVVVISHGGLDNSTYSPTMENGSYHLSKVAGVDAMLIGHSHQIFPDANSTVGQFNLPGVDKVKGTVNGVPTVMANYWGKHLGVINLSLNHDGKSWSVDRTKTTVEARSTQNADKTYVTADASVAPMIDTEHQATIQYVKTPIGSTNYRMSSYFADVGDPGAIQIVNMAQAAYVKDYVTANLPALASLPVLSVSAPFKSGFGGGSDYTDVASGNLAINNAADLYLYPNTVYAVKVNGDEVKAWLETAAKRFNQIDPAKTTDQQLISTFPGYNFDMFTDPDMQYEIDVTQPVGSRIKNLTYKGTPVTAAMNFIVATNNYRASGGGNFPGLDGTKTIYASPDANRDVLISYIKKVTNVTRVANGSARSWKFTKVTTTGKVVFSSGIGMLQQATDAGLTNISLDKADDGSGKNLSQYKLDLSL
ncbi:bifunctional 2',3'-cyclic-nucleotide 2'-phosphodiesterase/3'-nucleotidase [Cupriavidus metallidurans]|uniref:bifunctional 2',3'-cyclic-nucleotide 2'-phosphodiesterase/3'-nucleotidase n=1 Tax=Cupriavidus metallidurans TaxID=119219 RepID=UPI000559E417|nr:bifunctional 2',3'-cyclic-nucleotide 2'-phosphodiesterase/3'-nucleotidase [Cupriavidus metallidurans]